MFVLREKNICNSDNNSITVQKSFMPRQLGVNKYIYLNQKRDFASSNKKKSFPCECVSNLFAHIIIQRRAISLVRDLLQYASSIT